MSISFVLHRPCYTPVKNGYKKLNLCTDMTKTGINYINFWGRIYNFLYVLLHTSSNIIVRGPAQTAQTTFTNQTAFKPLLVKLPHPYVGEGELAGPRIIIIEVTCDFDKVFC